MIYLGIDPGTHRVGYGLIRVESQRMVPLAYGVIENTGTDRGLNMANIELKYTKNPLYSRGFFMSGTGVRTSIICRQLNLYAPSMPVQSEYYPSPDNLVSTGLLLGITLSRVYIHTSFAYRL